ncbi:Hypothetical protein R9X50_00421500 [Acrodontium crateriforme]|uniref:N-acetyltransferase domain-containing protein n=1 Tax=Acrodontium crateriforme TaxID=150365 RepID=A0AAQ3M5N5_9PEZI|nr:Hypothetical protein R9X50_00421500 [Acrodontium crateriforme]
MDNPPKITVCLTHWNDPAGVELRAAQRIEIAQNYSGEPGPAPSADDVPIFILVKVNGNSVACGGLRPLSLLPKEQITGAAEIKRMFVLPEYRGAAFSPGIASVLLSELEGQAMKNGWNSLLLETGVEMTKARAFYERHGYKQMPSFGHYIGVSTSVCYEKALK